MAMRILNRRPALLPSVSAALLLSAVASPSHASLNGFLGDYSPDNWAFNTELDGTGATEDISGAPDFIVLIGPNGGILDISTGLAPGAGLYTTTAVATGLVSFDWNLIIGEEEVSASDDPFGYLLNGSKFQLSDDLLGNQNNSFSFAVARGDSFGFYVATETSQFGPSTVTVSNFSAPVPGPLPVLGVAAAFRASRKLRVLTRKTAKRA